VSWKLGTTPVVPQICKWLRGVDLNHRPLGYEQNSHSLSAVESIAPEGIYRVTNEVLLT